MVDTKQIKELREITGIGMMECKKALEQTNGNIDLAVEELRKKGLAKAEKKADKDAYEGAIKIFTDNEKAYLVGVSCETDFLAKSDRFNSMLDSLINFLQEKGANSSQEAQEFLNKNYSLELGEKLEIFKYNIYEAPIIGSYVHSNGKIASLVLAKKGVDKEKAKQVSMHIAASKPDFLRSSDISSEIIEKEKNIYLEIIKNDPKMQGKPNDVLSKIIDGKIKKFKSEISLMEQDFVMNPDIKVKDFIGEDSIINFYRFSIG